MRLAEVELVLEGGLDADAASDGALDDVLEEGARAGAVALAVLLEQIAVHAGVLGHPGQDCEGLRIRHQAQLADGGHALDRDDRVDQRERHLGGGQVDAVAEAVGQVVDRGHLATLHAGEVAIHEADQLDAFGSGTIEDVLRVHSLTPRQRMSCNLSSHSPSGRVKAPCLASGGRSRGGWQNSV
jgi:hypothetical protein